MKKDNESWDEFTERICKEREEKINRVCHNLLKYPELVTQFVKAAYRVHDCLEQWEDDWRDDISSADSKDDVGNEGTLMHAAFVLDEYLEGVVPGDIWDWIKKQWPDDVKEFEENQKKKAEEEEANLVMQRKQEVLEATKHVASVFVSTSLPKGPMDRVLRVAVFEGNVNWERVFEVLCEEYPEEKKNLKAQVADRLQLVRCTKTK